MIYYLPAILFIISGLPQTVRLLKRKSSQDISLTMYLITLLAIFIVMVDAYSHNLISVFVSNTASFCISLVNVVLIVYYRKRPQVN
jgi:uncharacterized protein with PQ loop repeat